MSTTYDFIELFSDQFLIKGTVIKSKDITFEDQRSQVERLIKEKLSLNEHEVKAMEHALMLASIRGRYFPINIEHLGVYDDD